MIILEDGGVNPPRFYYSHEEINEALLAAGVTPSTEYDQQLARVSPTPVRSNQPALLTCTLVNGSNNHYRTATKETHTLIHPSYVSLFDIVLLITHSSWASCECDPCSSYCCSALNHSWKSCTKEGEDYEDGHHQA